MNNLELLQLMTDAANDAVQISKEEFDIDLDYSAKSIETVDNILMEFLNVYKDEVLEDKAVFTLCNVYGAYIGETFKKCAGGNWVYEENEDDAAFIFIEIEDKSYAFAGMCYEQLVNKSEMSIAEYFNTALSQHMKH